MATQIRKINGFKTPDGQVHDTLKDAQQHVKDQATKAALKDFVLSINDNTPHVYGTAGGEPLRIFLDTPDDLEGGLIDFLFEHREQVLAALQPKVEIRQRAPRKPKVAAPAAGSPQQ